MGVPRLRWCSLRSAIGKLSVEAAARGRRDPRTRQASRRGTPSQPSLHLQRLPAEGRHGTARRAEFQRDRRRCGAADHAQGHGTVTRKRPVGSCPGIVLGAIRTCSSGLRLGEPGAPPCASMEFDTRKGRWAAEKRQPSHLDAARMCLVHGMSRRAGSRRTARPQRGRRFGIPGSLVVGLKRAIAWLGFEPPWGWVWRSPTHPGRQLRCIEGWLTRRDNP